ncbi:EVE domain-containing protein [Algoriphagus namhaensis]|uniref:EVE domain-containing protein n=1 Tax=Algoriphagus namhaensis TaxID=915353 RepID=A0ABV8APQ6_9BACT
MNYWIVKSEPNSYSWQDFERAQEDVWDGVRNNQARLFLREMQEGDLVFFYHSGKEKAVVGLAEVSKEAFPDPNDEQWVAVNLRVKKKLEKPVTLAQLKGEDILSEMKMLKQSRLSVSPLEKVEFDQILKMSL